MEEQTLLANQFEAHRTHLRSVAYRMLGSLGEADDAVQEAWLRLSRTNTNAVENLGGWLTTVVARVCLDMLRTRTSRREEPLSEDESNDIVSTASRDNPEYETLMADSVGLALLVVLETLTPAERLACVLHDMFDVPFEEIASIVGRTPIAARQLASRARRRVHGSATVSDANANRKREIVTAFLAASRAGNFNALLALLDPEVVLHADPIAVPDAALREVRGAASVAKNALNGSGRSQVAQLAVSDGEVCIIVVPGGQIKMMLNFTITHEKIAAIDVHADPDYLRQLNPMVLEG